MEENIEVKDVQKTEYLDKNGLDMLWAKVKENTRNQVEAESNRAVTQETRIIETKADKAELNNYVSDTALKALEKKVSANTAAISGKQNAGNYLHYRTLNNDGYYEIPDVCVINGDNGTATSMSSDEIKVSGKGVGYTIITCDRVRNFYSDDGDFGFDLNSDGIKLQGGDNNHVLTSNGSTIDIIEYAKKTDIPEVDTSDFVSKNSTDSQSIKSSLNVSGSLSIGTNSPRISMYASDGAPSITLGPMSGNQYTVNLTTTQLIMGSTRNSVEITCDGISSTDNNANHVFATDGSIADLTQYALSSTLAALEQKVTDNTTAISGKQDAGNYIPYNMLAFKNKYVIEPSYSIEFRTDTLNNKYGKAFIGPQIISITSASGQNAAVEPEEISIKQSGNASGRIHSTLNVDSFGVYNNNDDSVIFKLNQYGIKLEDGDDNHVLTSNASTIDIREYALKSVYDKKIAFLEARIAALEAKHVED